jgi:VWFA-related protein
MRILKSLPAGFALLLVGVSGALRAQSPSSSPSSAGVSPTPSSAPPLNRTVRLIAIGRKGEPVTGLKPEDLRLFVNKQYRKILSVSSTASLPKTIGIFIGGYGPGPLPDKAIAAIQGLLNSVWQDQDMGFVVSFSDKIYKDVPSTSDLTQIENALPKILALNLERQSYLLSHWPAMPHAWYEAVSSARLSPKEARSTEKVYVVLSGFYSYDSAKSGINAVLSQQARIFPLRVVPPNPQGGAECVYASDPNAGGPCYLGLWKTEHTAKNIAKETGGDAFSLERKRDIIRAQTWLTNELRSTYIVTYETLPQSVSAGKIDILCKLSNVRLLYAKE